MLYIASGVAGVVVGSIGTLFLIRYVLNRINPFR